jgi:RNA polymerase sigma-70 factor (ECF subfamily)
MDDDDLVVRVAVSDDGAAQLFGGTPWLAVRLRAIRRGRRGGPAAETFRRWRGARATGRRGPAAAGCGDRPASGRAAAPSPGISRTGRDHAARRPDGRDGPDPADIALDRADLEVAVATLGPDGSPEREVWRLMYEQDRPVAEVAELLGVPPGTVKSRAHRVRRLLRAALRAPEGGTW